MAVKSLSLNRYASQQTMATMLNPEAVTTRTNAPPRRVQCEGCWSRRRLIAKGKQKRHLTVSSRHEWMTKAPPMDFLMSERIIMRTMTQRFSAKPRLAAQKRNTDSSQLEVKILGVVCSSCCWCSWSSSSSLSLYGATPNNDSDMERRSRSSTEAIMDLFASDGMGVEVSGDLKVI